MIHSVDAGPKRRLAVPSDLGPFIIVEEKTKETSPIWELTVPHRGDSCVFPKRGMP